MKLNLIEPRNMLQLIYIPNGILDLAAKMPDQQVNHITRWVLRWQSSDTEPVNHSLTSSTQIFLWNHIGPTKQDTASNLLLLTCNIIFGSVPITMYILIQAHAKSGVMLKPLHQYSRHGLMLEWNSLSTLKTFLERAKIQSLTSGVIQSTSFMDKNTAWNLWEINSITILKLSESWD